MHLSTVQPYLRCPAIDLTFPRWRFVRIVHARPGTIYPWHRLDDRITTSGQLTEPQIKDLHALGIRHIVNLPVNSTRVDQAVLAASRFAVQVRGYIPAAVVVIGEPPSPDLLKIVPAHKPRRRRSSFFVRHANRAIPGEQLGPLSVPAGVSLGEPL
jgi:hypothetical protein